MLIQVTLINQLPVGLPIWAFLQTLVSCDALAARPNLISRWLTVRASLNQQARILPDPPMWNAEGTPSLNHDLSNIISG
ncbi:MAG: hypothetical protein ACI87E_002517 [Mariniblastus sp.]